MEPTPPSHHEQPGPQEPAPSPGRRRFIVESAITLVTTAALAFGVQAAVAKPYLIPSESMLPTLEVGERVVVDRVRYRFASPEPGDIVVFRPPAGAEEQIALHLPCLPVESLPVGQCAGSVLRENIYAERDHPPFDRVMLDGIAIDSAAGRRQFRVQATQAAGDPPLALDPAPAASR